MAMFSGWNQLLLMLAVPLTFCVAVALSIIAGALYGGWAKRQEAMDPEQARLFSAARASLPARAWGLCVEIWFQLFSLVLRTSHQLRLLPTLKYDGPCVPILVLPGFTENAGTMWWLARRLSRAGFAPMLVDFPSTLHRIEQNVEFLRLFIAKMREKLGGAPIPVVAHSMGGLITRTLIHSHPDHGVATLVAIASPFRGTRLAGIGARLRMRGHCLPQMQPDSEFMRRFPPSLPCQVPILSLIAFQENIVVPEWSAVIADAECRVLGHPWGHMTPLFASEVYQQVEAWLLRYGVGRRQMDSVA